MHKESKKKNRVAIALTLCFCVMALTSVLAVKAGLDKIRSVSDPLGTTEEFHSAQQNTETAVQTPVVDSKSGKSTPKTSDKETTAKYIQPIEGNLLLKYSLDSLVYSKTLDQYMTHPGIDIAAALSSEVKAIAAGTVTSVYSNDRYGMTVEITHENGIISSYSNLAEQGLAEVGDEVKQGQVIGCVGKTALFESMDPSHLHFEMKEDNSIVDPGEYIKFDN